MVNRNETRESQEEVLSPEQIKEQQDGAMKVFTDFQNTLMEEFKWGVDKQNDMESRVRRAREVGLHREGENPKLSDMERMYKVYANIKDRVTNKSSDGNYIERKEKGID